MRSMIYLLLISLIHLCVGCHNAPSGAPVSEQVAQIDTLLKNRYRENHFHGAVVITQQGEHIYEQYFGIADRSWNIPVESNVKFDIASLNKSMTAALVLKAVEEDKIHLEDKLTDLLASFPYQGSFNPDINLHHLLSHTSGLADYDGIADSLRNKRFLTFKRLRFTNTQYVNFISQLTPVNTPGKQFYYSNFGYHLLNIILEDIYKMPFQQLLKEKLTEPLGLKHTLSESNNKVVIPNLAQGYSLDEDSGTWVQNPFIDLSLGRRIFSTATDLNRWGMAMDNPGYLSAHSLSLMQTNHLKDLSSTVSYGYGWVVVDAQNPSTMGNLNIDLPYIIHGGSTDGYRSMLININHGAYVISFLSNVGSQTEELELAKKIVKHLIRKP